MPVIAVVKWGNSLAVRIPKAAEDAGLREGEALSSKQAWGKSQLRRTERYSNLERGGGAESRYDEMPAGAEWRCGPTPLVTFFESGDGGIRV